MVVYVFWNIGHCGEFHCVAIQEFALRHWNWSERAQEEGAGCRQWHSTNTSAFEQIGFKASCSIDGDIENPNMGCVQNVILFTNGK